MNTIHMLYEIALLMEAHAATDGHGTDERPLIAVHPQMGIELSQRAEHFVARVILARKQLPGHTW